MTPWFWHKANETQPRGPVTEEALREMARYDELQRTDSVWREGWGAWVPAHAVPGLFDGPPTLAPVAPGFAGGGWPTPAGSASAGTFHVAADAVGSPRPMDGAAPSVGASYPDRLRGVGGWLAFFCVSITILTPLVTCGQLLTGWEEAKPIFDLYPSLKTGMTVSTVFALCIVIYGMVTGIMILSGRKDGKKLAEHYLIFSLLALVIGEIISVGIMDLPSDVSSVVTGETFKSFFREGVFFTVWFSYFRKSKRVAATYGA